MHAGSITVELVATALAEPNGVEPMPGPALAKPRAGEQTIDELFIGVGRGIVEESLQFGRGGQAREIKKTRRARVAFAASGAGASPASSCLARIKRSISFLAQPAVFTSGGDTGARRR